MTTQQKYHLDNIGTLVLMSRTFFMQQDRGMSQKGRSPFSETKSPLQGEGAGGEG